MAGQSSAGAISALLLGSIGSDGQLDGVTTGTSLPVDCSLRQDLAVVIISDALIAAGTLIVEEAWWDAAKMLPYEGTWSQISSTTLATPFAAAGGQYVTHLTPSAFKYVRVRIGTEVTGGPISVVLLGN